MTLSSLAKCFLAVGLALLFVGWVKANPPPQCNLPGWGKTTTTTSWHTRAPQGHTHTCANGHTWDHAANASHVCQFCGLTQMIQDRSPRPVTVLSSGNVSTRTVTAPVVRFSNCPNGNCPIAR